MAVRCILKTSQYFDSITLMRIARELRSLQGIDEAALVMGTDANKALLAQAGLLTSDGSDAGVNDLILVVQGKKQQLDAALKEAEALLTESRAVRSAAAQHVPRTIRTGMRETPGANLAVISVAGRFASDEAWDALQRGLHVLLFSDNVSIENEVALKLYAVEHDLLMMGPGAGTAVINGVALGFANALPRGPVGLVSAAGTGLQEVSTLLAREGVGISQGIGVGGRDLSDEVQGAMMLKALEMLDQDPATEVIVAISKAPSPSVGEKIERRLGKTKKPAVITFMGEGASLTEEEPGVQGTHVHHAGTLLEAAVLANALTQGRDIRTVRSDLFARRQSLAARAEDLGTHLRSGQRYLRGLFSGGTLCEEAMHIWREQVGAVYSNAVHDPEYLLEDVTQSRAHTALDMGDEVFTVGRPHPMIDNELRIQRLQQEARDPSVCAIQMDIVLGFGAHPDPAAEIAPAIEQARRTADAEGRTLHILLSMTGTENDPQDMARQRRRLEDAGALILESNAETSWLASMVALSASIDE